MNRSFFNKAVGAKGKMFVGAMIVMLTAMMLFVVCGGDDKKDNPGGPTSCPAGQTLQNGVCVPTGSGGGSGKFCYFPPSSYNNNTASCDEIGTPGATGAAASEAACEADYGYVITNCANPPTIQYCDFGQPVLFDGEEFGGCHAIPSNVSAATYCPAGEGEIVNTCPAYGPPEQGIRCDFGFNNLVPMTRARCEANPDGVIFGEVTPFYCDFGQPSRYGAGGCYVRFREFTGTYPGVADWYPDIAERPEMHAGCDPWAARVTLAQCLASNNSNGCVEDPVLPHIPPAAWATSPCCASNFTEMTAADYASTCGTLPGAQL